jgi:hypothetical protein
VPGSRLDWALACPAVHKYRFFAVVAVVLLMAGACGGKSDSPASGSGASSGTTVAVALTPAPEGLPNVVEVPVEKATHVNGKVSYPTVPPAGGPHNPVWQNCGFYSSVVTPERAVHSLEHGAVWIVYRSDVDAATKAQLRALAQATAYLLVSPRDDVPTPLTVVAWGRLLRLDAYDAEAIARFITTYAETGPTVPEPGAACKGGIGSPPDRPNQ